MTHIRSVEFAEFVKEKERTRLFTTDLHTPLPKSARKTNVGLAVKNLSLLKTISCSLKKKISGYLSLQGLTNSIANSPQLFF